MAGLERTGFAGAGATSAWSAGGLGRVVIEIDQYHELAEKQGVDLIRRQQLPMPVAQHDRGVAAESGR